MLANKSAEFWSTPGTWLLLAMTIAFFGPRVWDRHIRARPCITAEIGLARCADGQSIVRSVTEAHHRRLLWIEDTRGETLGKAQRADRRGGRPERTWTFAALMEHQCAQPAQPCLCSKFAVEIGLGSPATFGPFCSHTVRWRG